MPKPLAYSNHIWSITLYEQKHHCPFLVAFVTVSMISVEHIFSADPTIFLSRSSRLNCYFSSSALDHKSLQMAAFVSLSKRDINVLGKIRDPESNTTGAIRLDPSLPRDPHVTDSQLYECISQEEKGLVLLMQRAEMELAGLQPKSLADPIETYRQSVADLGQLIAKNPSYASARNNRAQALRRLYGDDMLLQHDDAEVNGMNGPGDFVHTPQALLGDMPDNEAERARAAATVLSDLERCIALLMPANPLSAALSPTAAKTLSLAFTQRAAIYHSTSKRIGPSRKILAHLATTAETREQEGEEHVGRAEAQWSRLDFEEAASRDFAMGGRFGNEIARGLAVGTNPTAKLCGQMVQQMMKNEYGSLS